MSTTSTTSSTSTKAPLKLVRHVLVRTGKQNWDNRADPHVWGFDKDASSASRLMNLIGRKKAIVWFISPRDSPNGGRVVGMCIPREMKQKQQGDASDEEMHWEANNVFHHTSYSWRMETGNITEAPLFDDELTTRNLESIHGKRINQNSINIVNWQSPLHRYLNKSFKKYAHRR